MDMGLYLRKKKTLLIAVAGDASMAENTDMQDLLAFLQDGNACIFINTSTSAAIAVPDSARCIEGGAADIVALCNKAIEASEYRGYNVLLMTDFHAFNYVLFKEVESVLSASERHAVSSPRMAYGEFLAMPVLNEISDAATVEQRTACACVAQSHLPQFSRIPLASPSYALLNGTVLHNIGGFDVGLPSLSAALADFCLRAGDYGYNAVAANHAFYSWNDDRGLAAEDKAILQERHPHFKKMVERYWQDDICAADYFLDLMTDGFYQKPRLLLEFSDLLPLYNGTVEYQLAVMSCFDARFADVYDIDVLVSREGAEFHQVESRFSHCRFVYELTGRYHLGFSARQPVDIDEQFLMNRHCLKIVYTMLDVISLRCDYLRVDWENSENVRQGLRMCDAVISISNFSRDDYRDYFNDSLDISQKPVKTVYLGTDFGEGLHPLPEFELPFEEYILIVGNSFKHKALKEAVEAVAHTESSYIVVGLGNGEYLYPNVYGYPSARLSEAFLAFLYAHCRVLLFPSLYEGFGLPVIIALKYGRRTVVNDNAVNREIAQQIPALADKLTFFKCFDALPGIIENVLADDPAGDKPYSRSWDDAIVDIEAYFAEVIDAPVDKEGLAARWRTVNLVESTSRKAEEKMQDSIGFKRLLYERCVAGHPWLEKMFERDDSDESSY